MRRTGSPSCSPPLCLRGKGKAVRFLASGGPAGPKNRPPPWRRPPRVPTVDRAGLADRGGLEATRFIPNCLSPASEWSLPPRPLRPAGCRPYPFQDSPMGKKLYVGNLSYDVDSAALEQMFSEFGAV